MALLEVMEMKVADLQFLTTNFNGAMGSSGTGSGPQCDHTTVHCCFRGSNVIKVAPALPGESASGYKLIVGTSEFGIGIESPV